MIAKLRSADIYGVGGRVVEIEVDLLPGLSNFVISGLPGKGIRESRERIRSAITHAGFSYPTTHRIVINLAPAAAWEKDGAGFDLPIALGVLLAAGQVGVAGGEWAAVGELALDGRVRPVMGTLGLVQALRKEGAERILVPVENLPEALAVPGARCGGVTHLRHAAAVLEGTAEAIETGASAESVPEVVPEFAHVIGHRRVKRALALAVAGGHNVLMVGPPGSGKSFLARRIPALLPAPTREEILEVTQIHSALGIKKEPGLIQRRPFRSPHHTVSWAGLVGGGAIPKPGEITLAHRGVLFLDELPEFQRRALEALREPLEEGSITISRASATLCFPASFLLVAAMNPCPCGFHRHPRVPCHCPPERIRRYMEKISGPLLDRIDVRLQVRSPASEELLAGRSHDGGDTRSLAALVRQTLAFQANSGRRVPNRALEWADRRGWAPLTKRAERLLNATAADLALTGRGLTRVLRLARTIADASQVETIDERHLLEALEYRV